MRNLLTGMLMIGLSSAGCLSKLSSPATNGATGDSSGTSGAAGTGSQTAAEVAGRSAMRRLTAAEWQNSVQSVLGTNITLDPLYQVADQLNVMDFPTDGSSQTIATGDLNTMYLQLEEAVTATFAQGTPGAAHVHVDRCAGHRGAHRLHDHDRERGAASDHASRGDPRRKRVTSSRSSMASRCSPMA